MVQKFCSLFISLETKLVSSRLKDNSKSVLKRVLAQKELPRGPVLFFCNFFDVRWRLKIFLSLLLLLSFRGQISVKYIFLILNMFGPRKTIRYFLRKCIQAHFWGSGVINCFNISDIKKKQRHNWVKEKINKMTYNNNKNKTWMENTNCKSM